MKSKLAEPMRQALSGRSGIIIGLDYRNVMTLAAHEPVAILKMGVVAKIDMDEVRAPFIRAGIIVFGIGLVVISLGTLLFFKVSNAMVQQLMETAALRKSRLELANAQEKLQEKAIYLDNILRTSFDQSIIATDLDFKIKYYNPASEKIFGYRWNQVLDRDVYDIHRELDVETDRFEQGIHNVRTRGEHTYIFKKPLAKGCRIVESRVTGILDHDGRLSGFVLMSRDITKARKAQEALERSEKKYRLLIESANDAIFIADAQSGKIIDANEMAVKLLGRPKAEIIGMHQAGLHPPQDVERYQKLFQEQVRKGTGALDGIFIVRKDGTTVPVEIRAGVTDLDDQRVIQGIFRDITERLHLEAQLKAANQDLEQRVLERTRELQQSNKDLQEFAYAASHDLQEPLRQISGYVQLLKRHYKGRLDAKADQYIDHAMEGVSHMQNLITNLLDYARVDNRGEDPVEIDINDVLDRAMANLKSRIEETGAVLTRSPLPVIRANELQMIQLFQNLIGNALKFRGDTPPRIHVAADREVSGWTFSVKDNGIGIDRKYLQRIFQIFQKLHPRSRYEGTGIGLALCRRIVERHGGRIWGESEPGRGSTFRFSISDQEAPNQGPRETVERFSDNLQKTIS